MRRFKGRRAVVGGVGGANGIGLRGVFGSGVCWNRVVSQLLA